ncbi:hypothetical protein CDAR_64801 [Caerostris darwini]|uniref:Transposase n=1 Tax=Caerostris darwini TaxID=1538125 RepID=A0AAV4NBT8_9ARAC|nr:hypothetical protein CDAR_64801 [Caerostris darwini]
MDETWVHHYTPETKPQTKRWVEAGSSAAKKAKSIASAGKIMASVFWVAKEILLNDYLAKAFIPGCQNSREKAWTEEKGNLSLCKGQRTYAQGCVHDGKTAGFGVTICSAIS